MYLGLSTIALDAKRIQFAYLRDRAADVFWVGRYILGSFYFKGNNVVCIKLTHNSNTKKELEPNSNISIILAPRNDYL